MSEKMTPKSKRPPGPPLTKNEINRLRRRIQDAEIVSLQRGDRTGVRNRAIIEVFLYTGVRVTELCNFNNEDFDLKESRILIRSIKRKDGHVFYMPMNNEFRTYIEKYAEWKAHYELVNAPDSPFILSKRNKRLARSTVHEIVVNLFEEAKIGGRAHCHRFRHTVGTRVQETEKDIRFTQEWLRHKHITTTQRYATVTPQRLKDVSEKLTFGTNDDEEMKDDG